GGRPPRSPTSSGPGRRRGTEEANPVITIDGPAGSGKSTTAREVARKL
ncbi:MAG: cytidylate kinase, partial [Gemmatimonadetes bacterium]|nr:cytidylate kinase [Gemmatimonadota bacterium]NIR78414.1 cytidylate kinase [Gemmatimonadota bacterium]NIT87026.1 cytidylate kinase [Gemmatimonadota bacterium]NIU30864.1 cytidylate kinase [Gemmatimonadota bacterium]NIU35633.1 cytidylate kinase [Gemmatimonadota bacterium]